MNLEQRFKKETGFDAYADNDLRPKVPNDYYVEWLEEQLTIDGVSQRSELLKVEDKDVPFDYYINKYFKEPKIELIYRSKRNGGMMTESQLIKYYKRAMCL